MNAITAKQRLFLYNSARLSGALSGLKGKVDSVYWRFYSRAPTKTELKAISAAGAKTRDVAWCLMNSREFLYRG